MKRLLVIDPHVSLSSPSMRGWVNSFDDLVELFDEVEVWSVTCDVADHPKVKWVKCHAIKTWVLQAELYTRQVRHKINSLDQWPPENTIVQVCGFYIKHTDIRYIHFSNMLFKEEQKKRTAYLKLSWFRDFLVRRQARNERRVMSELDTTKYWWVVSKRLGEALHRENKNGGVLRILPNSYNDEKFSHQTRLNYRNKMRRHYGYSDNEIVFTFSAFAHFERKGLLSAVGAIALARSEGAPFRFLILGGKPKVISKFKARMHHEGISEEGITFGGMVTNIEQHLSSSDALLFPSHFEAFSLAEIESGAMGLRLYLTRHYGAEMILNDPANGKWIDWDAHNICKVLTAEWKSGVLGHFHEDVGSALSITSFSKQLCSLYAEVLANRDNQAC